MSRKAEVLARLDAVLDPEIDRSVVAMGFIQELEEADGAVRVSFRLPTHWCAANFAFLMASDMRSAIEALPWVTQIEVRLLDHFAAGRINRVVNEQGGFADVFPGEASGGLDALRHRFGEKAFLARQEALLRPLAHGRGVEAALALRVGELEALAQGGGALSGEATRYLSLRRQFGGLADPQAPAFTDLTGQEVRASGYVEHMRGLRRGRGAADANAEHCQILMLARQAAPAPEDRSSPAGLYE